MSRRATKTWGDILLVYNTLAVTTTTEMEATLMSVIFTTNFIICDGQSGQLDADRYLLKVTMIGGQHGKILLWDHKVANASYTQGTQSSLKGAFLAFHYE